MLWRSRLSVKTLYKRRSSCTARRRQRGGAATLVCHPCRGHNWVVPVRAREVPRIHSLLQLNPNHGISCESLGDHLVWWHHPKFPWVQNLFVLVEGCDFHFIRAFLVSSEERQACVQMPLIVSTRGTRAECQRSCFLYATPLAPMHDGAQVASCQRQC